MKKIILVSRGNINASPTITNYLNAFSSLGFDVYCICSSNDQDICLDNVKVINVGFSWHSNFLIKILNYFRFRQKALKVIENIGIDSDTIFWVSRVDTALCMWRSLKASHAILALHEIHDRFPVWKYITRKVISSYSNVVLNEINRANIVRVWYGLPYTPSVVPNKPCYHPLELNIDIINPELSELIENIKNKKRIILYQGSLLADRNLEPLVRAAKGLDDDFCLVIMGKDTDNRIDKLRDINPEIVHIPWVVPPDHLSITSHAYIGVAFYDFDCLNSIYCAPNKIWEYAGFGIPVLCQNIPGLISTVGTHKAGVCVDIDDVANIEVGLRQLLSNYSYYQNNAKVFYSSVDFQKSVSLALESNGVNSDDCR